MPSQRASRRRIPLSLSLSSSDGSARKSLPASGKERLFASLEQLFFVSDCFVLMANRDQRYSSVLRFSKQERVSFMVSSLAVVLSIVWRMAGWDSSRYGMNMFLKLLVLSCRGSRMLRGDQTRLSTTP